jgi:hypothetical protein
MESATTNAIYVFNKLNTNKIELKKYLFLNTYIKLLINFVIIIVIAATLLLIIKILYKK